MPLSNSQVTIIYIFIWFLIERPTDVRQELWRLYANLRAFLSRFLTLACVPRRFAPLVADYWLLVQSIWSGKQSGPDLVYPMLSIRKRQSGHLAKLILEHCRAVRRYKIHAETQFPEGIEPPCVAVVDLDEVPREVVENGYSTQVDVYGLMAMLILFTVMLAFIPRILSVSPRFGKLYHPQPDFLRACRVRWRGHSHACLAIGHVHSGMRTASGSRLYCDPEWESERCRGSCGEQLQPLPPQLRGGQLCVDASY